MQEQISQWKKIVFQILDFRGFYLLNPPIDIHGTANRVRWRLNQILSALIAYFFLVWTSADNEKEKQILKSKMQAILFILRRQQEGLFAITTA